MAPRLALVLVPAAVLLALAFSLPATVAQTAPAVTDGGVENRFPQGMAFSVSARSDSTIERIRLRYKILPDGTSAIAQPEFQPGKSVAAVVELEGNNPPRIYLPPGTRVEYRWEVTDADGDVSETPTASFVYDDTRFQWSTLSDRGVTIHFYSGSRDDASRMLAVAAETFTRMAELLGARIDFPVSVWAYDSVQDMRPALARRSETYEQSVITAGVRVSSDTVLVLGNVSFDTLRHELTHVVTAQAGESALGMLPAWLDEGTAVYAQDDPGRFRNAIENAIQRGDVFSVRSITSSPGEARRVDLFYGQSWSLVKYLVDGHGPEMFAQLFAQVKSGKGIDSALQAVYGFDQDGLEDRWREANGLPPRETPAATQPPQETGRPSAGQTENENGGTSAGTVATIAVGAIALAGAVAVLGWALRRRFG